MTAQEDYRVKNAREGKAIYLPGKSIEQMKAELRGERIKLELFEGDVRKMRGDAEAANLTLALIHDALWFLSRASDHEAGNMTSVLELIARAAQNEQAAERLVKALDGLHSTNSEAKS